VFNLIKFTEVSLGGIRKMSKTIGRSNGLITQRVTVYRTAASRIFSCITARFPATAYENLNAGQDVEFELPKDERSAGENVLMVQ
jgi:hypothetical protein